MLKIICAGLPRTGTTSLAEALRILGYNTLHHAPERLPLFPTADTDAKVILTVRNVNDWYKSMVRHIAVMRAAGDQQCDRLHSLVFGSAEPSEYWYKRRYIEHMRSVAHVMDKALCSRPLMVNVTTSQNDLTPWIYICNFLNQPIPDVPFPWLNKGETTQ